jgi:hypothetical protein
MAENRCPMCSKENPAENEVCEFCGARLTPLVVGSSSEEEAFSSTDLPDGEDTEDEAPDWLSRIRSQSIDDDEPEIETESDSEPMEEVTSGDDPAWLGRLREATVEEQGPPEEELPDWVGETPLEETSTPEIDGSMPPETPPADQPPAEIPADEAPQDATTPDWLLRIRERAAESPEAEEEFPIDADDEDWLAKLREQDEAEEPDVEPEPGSEAEPPEVPPDIPIETPVDSPEQPEEPGQEPPVGESDQDDLIESDSGVFRFPEAPDTGQSWVEVPEESIESPIEAEELAQDLPVDEPAFEEPEMEQGFESVAAEIKAKVEPSDAPSMEEGLPSWLDELQAPDVEDESPPEDEAIPKPESEMEEPVEPEQPPAADELPHVPALVVEGKPADISDVDAFDLDAAEVEVPDWFEEMKKDAGAGEEEEKPDLAPATLPAWLEAMRPVETFRSGVEITPEEDQSIESAGPLAGLRGVLIAEPIVAMPRTPSIGSTQLDISERQYAQAEMLQRMVKQEERESVSAPAFQPRLTLLRILIGALLLAVVLLPILFGFPTFSLPTLEPIELGVLSNTVESLPMDQPVLMVFDYDPGYSAEMEAVAGAFIEQITSRNLPVATMSTRPTGSQLALALMEKFGSRHGYIPGEDLIHLGFLSGGPLAVQLFAASPRDAILQGFALPPTLEDSPGGAWDAPMLQGVDQLSDFGMVAVITSGTDNARNWAEQAKPYMYAGGADVTPLVMVMSAGAEPLLRPYYEASEPRINGLLSGLPAAAAYELRNGVPGDAQARWNPFGAGILLAQIILLVGIGYGILIWFLQRNRAKRS